MTHVITEPCVGTKDASCVAVCPVDCILEGEDHYVIDASRCVDCGACIPACPVSAIFEERDVPTHWKRFIDVRADQ